MTLKEIADIVGVSSSTVSLVLNNRDGVGAETRQKVERALRQYNYVPRKQAKSNLSDIIYIAKYAIHGMIAEENQGFIASIVDQIIQECNCNDIDVIIANYSKTTIKQIVSDVELSGASGVIFIGTELSSQQAEELTLFSVPLVVVDNACMYRNLNSVLMTNQDIAYIATKYLIDLGHQEIGYLCSNTSTSNLLWRKCGYEEALADHQVKRGVRLPVTPTLSKAYEDMREHLAIIKNLPSAFFADNDTIAIGAMRAIQEAGYKIPQDVSIIGVDNIPYSAVCNPPLTTISISRNEMGIQAVNLLRYKIVNPQTPPIRVQVCGELTVRASTQIFQKNDDA